MGLRCSLSPTLLVILDGFQCAVFSFLGVVLKALT